jgi:hypothetical protein
LNFNDQDRKLLASTSDFVPEYMWPEDGEGYNNYGTSVRPHISEAMDWDPEFSKNFDFNRFDHFLEPKNGLEIPAVPYLLTSVWLSNPVVLVVPSAMFETFQDNKSMFNHNTGLLNSPYDLQKLKEIVTISQRRMQKDTDFESGFNHAVAVVGYDDFLYSDHNYYYPGAIIVKNSWNSDKSSNQFITTPTTNELEDLKKMRYKINGSNAPGYYAIPIQFLYDLVSYQKKNGKLGLGYFSNYSLDYNLFYTQYIKFQNKYKTYKLPYSCDNIFDSNYRFSSWARRDVDELVENFNECNNNDETACIKYKDILYPYTTRFIDMESPQKAFNFAKLSYRKGSLNHPIDKFYSGMFASYYCGFSQSSKIWPYENHAKDKSFRKAIEKISREDDLDDAWRDFFFSLDHMKAQDEYQ